MMSDDPAAPVQLARYGLKGKVVTMNADFGVLDRGVVYVDGANIAAVLPASAAPPPGFEDTSLLDTRGVIFPGLIELHNHLSYNVLPLWNVPRRFTNRSQWGAIDEYRRRISGPMTALGRTPGYVEAIVRYVECKCLVAGVTTTQGIALFSNNGIQKYYRGVVRNVEETGEAQLPDAATKISDVEAADALKFLARLEKSSCVLLHLSEGIDPAARRHFEALRLDDGRWAVRRALAGIHCAGLNAEDFGVLKENGASMIWSPLSNLLLYGQTADIRAAKDSGIRIGIGSDWSPSGSKNLLAEMKVARLYSQANGDFISDRDIVAMATCEAAKILNWENSLGSLEAGKRADLLVISGRSGDPYERLLRSRETSIALVVIDGVARYGVPRLMDALGETTETLSLRGVKRSLNLAQTGSDPVVGELSLGAAADRLRKGMRSLRELAFALENRPPTPPGALADLEPQWFLVLDHDDVSGEVQRPQLPFGDAETPTGVFPAPAASAPLSEILEPIELDALTVRADRRYFEKLAQQANLPEYVKTGLLELYL